MKRKLISPICTSFLVFLIGHSCTKVNNLEPDIVLESEKEIDSTDSRQESDSLPLENSGADIVFYDASKVADGCVLINDAAANRVYLINKQGGILHEWSLEGQRLGNDVFLLPNGKLLAMLEVSDPEIQIGGFGGKVQLLGKDGTPEWSFEYSSEDYILHHDAEMLPNGNIIAQIWERKSIEETKAAGYILETEVFPDGIIEIDPATNTIVWEWHAWDHLIQDYDETKNNFGNVSENPHLIDVNYAAHDNGDITHANGIAYDSINDLIFISVNLYSEVWVIDHSTTSEEAASSQGGNFGKGGNIIYRFGNPSAYRNTKGERLFYNIHFPNILKEGDLGKIIVFSNGGELEQSTVYELQLPHIFKLSPDSDNEPEVVWHFNHKELFSPKVSGAVKLSNDNVLITEGDFGLWEVTKEKEIVWKYMDTGFFWRGYHYNDEDEAIISLDLNH
jgi:hypothetical protein